jgi:cation:H+ antiporter
VTPLAWTAALFVACGLLILVSGVHLSRYGDAIAEKTGLGGTWMGLLVIASVTSLPELITSASSILVFDAADIAAGDAIGSCMFNLLILSFLDFRNPAPLSARIHQGHVLAAAFGIVLLGIAMVAMVAGDRAPALGWIGWHSLLMLALYVLAMRTIFTFERTRMAALAEVLAAGTAHEAMTLRSAILRFAVAALALVGAAALLPGAGERLAAETGLGESFVGSLFVAVSTSLPEVVVSVAAARIGAMDMAVGNLFGSNLFNMAVLGLDDVFYRKGSVLAAVSPVHMVSLTTAIIMTAVAIVGVTYRASRKRYRLSWDALAILAAYVIGATLLRALG